VQTHCLIISIKPSSSKEPLSQSPNDRNTSQMLPLCHCRLYHPRAVP